MTRLFAAMQGAEAQSGRHLSLPVLAGYRQHRRANEPVAGLVGPVDLPDKSLLPGQELQSGAGERSAAEQAAFFLYAPRGRQYSAPLTKWGNPGLPWPISSRAADAERAVIRIVTGGGRRSGWQRSGHKSGANRAATSQARRSSGNDTAGKRLELLT